MREYVYKGIDNGDKGGVSFAIYCLAFPPTFFSFFLGLFLWRVTVIFLDISVNEAERRGGYGEERFETKEFQEKVYKVYLQLKADDEGAENGVGTRWSIVDACQSVDSVAKDILKAANEAICRPRPEELGELWKNRLHIIG